MERRFIKVKKSLNYYFQLKLDLPISSYHSNIFVPCDFPIHHKEYEYYTTREEYTYQSWGEYEITDYCNYLCFKIIESFGFEFNEDNSKLENVVYSWDQNLIPGERFIGIKLTKLDGTETCIEDLFPNLIMELDVLSYYRVDLNGYTGLKDSYRLYLPYTEDGLEIYRKYLEYEILTRHNGKIRIKNKNSDLLS